MATPRLSRLGDHAWLFAFEPSVDVETSARVLDLAAWIGEQQCPGVRDIVPALASVAVHWWPQRPDAREVEDLLGRYRRRVAAARPPEGAVHEIVVAYGGDDGPDLAAVAAAVQLEPDEVVRRHCAVTYHVFMLGFLPGFPYLGPVDSTIHVSRLAVPRTRVPAGSVGLAGAQTGIYPTESPGGWRIIGRTDAVLFDATGTPPSRLKPGDRVRFVPRLPVSGVSPMSTLLVERPGLLTTVQDRGRWGWQHLGVPVSGWMDDWSARLANRLSGNADGDAVLEVTWLGPTLRANGPMSIAITGAVFDVTIGGFRMRSPLACDVAEGATIEFGERQSGTRAYLAVSGGFAIPPVLGSRATDIRSGLGGLHGRRLQKGDPLPVGGSSHRVEGVRTFAAPPWIGQEPQLRVLRASEASSIGDEQFHHLCETQFRLAAASDRTGYRLMADQPLPDATALLISQPVVTGAVQLPPGGTPLLLMADRQTTGGYAVAAVVIAADLPLAGQLGPGDACRFSPCEWHEAVAASDDREQALDQFVPRIG